jgi:phytoene synthase
MTQTLHIEKDMLPYYKFAEHIIKHYAKSFYFASSFLPKDKRLGTYAVYCFCRYVDNIVDKPRQRDTDTIRKEIEDIGNEIELAYQSGESEHPALAAFMHTAMTYKIPIEYPLDLLKGMLMDLTIDRYDTFNELYIFCYRVASVVGLMMSYVLGFDDKRALGYAEKMGIGMQLTNILRDVKEDKEMGRIYIPLEDLKRFGISEDDVFTENFDDKFKAMMAFQAERSKQYYQDSLPGIEMLHKNSKFAIATAGKIYSAILDKLEEQDYNPFKGRVFLSKKEKMLILMQELLKNNISLNLWL